MDAEVRLGDAGKAAVESAKANTAPGGALERFVMFADAMLKFADADIDGVDIPRNVVLREADRTLGGRD